jgi:hypothetical protein
MHSRWPSTFWRSSKHSRFIAIKCRYASLGKKYPELSDISSASPYPIFWISGVSEENKKSPEARRLG